MTPTATLKQELRVMNDNSDNESSDMDLSPILKKGELSAEFIADLLANTRTRNQYGPKLVEFFNSDEPAVNPQEAWPELATKNLATIYQGFINALKKTEDPTIKAQLTILKRNDAVFILHNERARVVAASAVVTQADDTDNEE
jgi:hypothetical protein